MKRILSSIILGVFIASVSHAQQKSVTSFLEIVDINTTERTIVKEFPYLIEAPNWTPDGKWLIYNSNGKLYKVSSETEQTQITFDETRNAWFPHISPDGKQVVFLTYYKGDLNPNQHLPNKNVELRIMPTTGGEPKTILKLFGGQGTINVNSWAPDSKRLAFVSYQISD